jgi:hypothetical protein
VRARYLLILVSMVFLTLAPGFAHAQGSLDISLPASCPMATTKAYGSSYNTVDVWGPVDVFMYGGAVYVAIPTNAPEGVRLAFFQDANASWTLFRNNTLALPVQGQSANFLLATGDLISDGGRFYGQVTGMELDTKALSGEGASAVAVLYLDELPGRALYRVSLMEDDDIKKAVMGEASKAGQAGIVKLMLEVSGTTPEAQGSIGYTVIRMKADGLEPDGNVTAYRYFNGAVSTLPCKTITSAEGPVYETICAGPGTFAFVGPFREPPPEKAGMRSVLAFSGIIALLMLLLVTLTIVIIKRSSKKSGKN